MSNFRTLALSLCLVPTLLACPAEDDTGSSANICEGYSFSACGGDIVGSWTLDSFCPADSWEQVVPIDEEEAACDTSNTVIEIHFGTTQFSFNGNGTFTQAASVQQDIVVNVDRPCIEANAGPQATSEAFCSGLESGIQDDIPGIVCAVDALDGCRCNATATDTISNDGTYEVDGVFVNMLDTGDDPSLAEATPFCVNGTALDMDLSSDPLPGQDETYALFTKVE